MTELERVQNRFLRYAASKLWIDYDKLGHVYSNRRSVLDVG